MITAYPRILFHGYRRYTYEIAVINAHKAALIVKHKPDMLSTFFFFFFFVECVCLVRSAWGVHSAVIHI